MANYFEKHFRVVELSEIKCGKCGNWLGVDLDACETEPDDLTPRYWAIFYCPYCKSKQRHFV